jgi:circadian clock protein KaiC
VELQDVYIGAEGVLTGSARQTQEAKEKTAALLRQQEVEGKQRERERKREALEARIAAMRKDFEAEDEEAKRIIGQEHTSQQVVEQDREEMGRSRKSDTNETPARSRKTPGSRK